jgi:hypothetical protein
MKPKLNARTRRYLQDDAMEGEGAAEGEEGAEDEQA